MSRKLCALLALTCLGAGNAGAQPKPAVSVLFLRRCVHMRTFGLCGTLLALALLPGVAHARSFTGPFVLNEGVTFCLVNPTRQALDLTVMWRDPFRDSMALPTLVRKPDRASAEALAHAERSGTLAGRGERDPAPRRSVSGHQDRSGLCGAQSASFVVTAR